MLETKILISYLIICIVYSMCRLHYLLTMKEDEEFNSMLEDLINLSESKNIIKSLVLLQIMLSPITTPFSIMKQLFKLLLKPIIKK